MNTPLVASMSALLLAAAVLSSGCKSADAAPSEPTAAPADVAAKSAAPVAPAPPPDPIAGYVDVDLAPGGKLWAPFHIKAPAGAKVRKAFSALAVEVGDWGVAPSFTDTRFSSTESDLNTAIAYGVKWKALEKTADLFEYQIEGEQDGKHFERFAFHMLVKVDGKTYGCSSVNNQKSREDLVSMKAACRTLAKK